MYRFVYVAYAKDPPILDCAHMILTGDFDKILSLRVCDHDTFEI